MWVNSLKTCGCNLTFYTSSRKPLVRGRAALRLRQDRSPAASGFPGIAAAAFVKSYNGARLKQSLNPHGCIQRHQALGASAATADRRRRCTNDRLCTRCTGRRKRNDISWRKPRIRALLHNLNWLLNYATVYDGREDRIREGLHRRTEPPYATARSQSAGCSRIFNDRISGGAVIKPGFEGALRYLRAGDTLCIWRLDRLSQSLHDLLALAERLHMEEPLHHGTHRHQHAQWPAVLLGRWCLRAVRTRRNSGAHPRRSGGRTGGRQEGRTQIGERTKEFLRVHDFNGPFDAAAPYISDLADWQGARFELVDTMVETEFAKIMKMALDHRRRHRPPQTSPLSTVGRAI